MVLLSCFTPAREKENSLYKVCGNYYIIYYKKKKNYVIEAKLTYEIVKVTVFEANIKVFSRILKYIIIGL